VLVHVEGAEDAVNLIQQREGTVVDPALLAVEADTDDAGDPLAVRRQVKGPGLLADTEVAVGPLLFFLWRAVRQRIHAHRLAGSAQADDLHRGGGETEKTAAGARLDVRRRVGVPVKVIDTTQQAEPRAIEGDLVPAGAGACGRHHAVLVGGRVAGASPLA